MEQEITLPADAEKISPTFITAPANHCGGAMLQRAFCSGENSLCYGDNMMDEILSLVDWAINLIERHQEQEEWETNHLTRALGRDPATWMPELGPPHEIYTAALFSVVYNLPGTAQAYAQEQGRGVWQISRASLPSFRLNDLGNIFPGAKSIFIHRNPMDVARDTLRDHPDSNIREICDAWNDSMRDYLAFASDRLLKVRYEDAVEDTNKFVATLQDFTGATGINPAVLTTGTEAETDSDYEMGDDLKALVQSQCEDMLAVYYPEMVA
jgi:hypothetical protein